MNNRFSIIILLVSAFVLVQCAKRGNPTGGDIDTKPPKFLRASPENYSTNFEDKEIRIYFDEYIKLDKPQEQIIISPPMTPRPEITPMGGPQKYIRIKITDTLQENTTYVVNFGRSVVDNNEANPLPFFKYVFSTGTYIDSLTVKGTVQDALLKEAEPFISVMLYEVNENFSDSLVYNEPPRYITNTLDSLRSFELTNLKAGTYQLVAVKDVNNDYKFTPSREKIGFLDSLITVPKDTSYNLVLFKEKLEFRPERPKQLAGNKVLIGYRGTVNPDSLSFQPLSPVPADFDYRLTKVQQKDSIHFWMQPLTETDSLKLKVTTPTRIDTLKLRITEMKPDTLLVTMEPSGSIEFSKNVVLRATTPVVEKNDEFISIMNRDSVQVNFTSELKSFENVVELNFTKNENQSYRVTVLPGALKDFYGATNDTLTKSFNTKALSDYGNLSLNLQNVKSFPVIVQLTDEKGVVKAEKYSTSQTGLRFEFITPGKYLIRLIYDRNENRQWDTGNYLKGIKPEEIIYFPEILDVRPNWDVIQPFILN